MASRGGSKRRGKGKKTARKALPKRGSKLPKPSSVKTAPREIKKRVIKHGEAVEYLGGEKTLKKGSHKIFETGPLTIGKGGIAVVKAIVDGLEKLKPSTKLAYDLEVRFNGKDGERRRIKIENSALPILQNIKISGKDKKAGRTQKDKWLSIVYGRLREKIFQPLIAEFGFISGKRVPTHRKVGDKKVRVRNRAEVIRQVEQFRKGQNTRFKLTVKREVF